MAEMINLSEGEKQKKINEAEGRAKEIEAIAIATAGSIEKIAAAITGNKGEDAINMKLSQQYLTEFSKLAQKSNELILPINIGSFQEVLKGIDTE